MGVKLNTASNGSVTIDAANTASNFTLTVPAQTGTVVASDSSGNVGIGTSSPAQKLDVNGSVAMNGVMTIKSSGTTVGYFGDADGTSNVQLRSQNAIEFKAGGNTERMRIDSSGNVLVGVTSFSNGVNGKSIDALVYGSSRSTTSSANHCEFRNPNGQVGTISTSGSSTTYGTSSDYRLKENIVPMTGALGVVQQLKPVTYSWKIDGSSGQGFIAHELQAVVPDCVTGEKDAVDAEGNPVYQGIDTSFLVATLTAAIQELNAKVDAQAAEIALLKGQA